MFQHSDNYKTMNEKPPVRVTPCEGTKLVETLELVYAFELALNYLPSLEKRIVCLRINTDMTFEQIGNEVGEIPQTTHSYYHKALDKLRSDPVLGEVLKYYE